MHKHGFWSWVAFICLLVGGLNWGLIGFFHFNFITFVFGDLTVIARIIYAIIGLAAVFAIVRCFCKCGKCCQPTETEKKK